MYLLKYIKSKDIIWVMTIYTDFLYQKLLALQNCTLYKLIGSLTEGSFRGIQSYKRCAFKRLMKNFDKCSNNSL